LFAAGASAGTAGTSIADTGPMTTQASPGRVIVLSGSPALTLTDGTHTLQFAQHVSHSSHASHASHCSSAGTAC
jgi:hypothetical protein